MALGAWERLSEDGSMSMRACFVQDHHTWAPGSGVRERGWERAQGASKSVASGSSLITAMFEQAPHRCLRSGSLTSVGEDPSELKNT